MKNCHASLQYQKYLPVKDENVLTSGTYVLRVTAAISDFQYFISPVVMVFRTEIDKSLANKPEREKCCRGYLEKVQSLKLSSKPSSKDP